MLRPGRFGSERVGFTDAFEASLTLASILPPQPNRTLSCFALVPSTLFDVNHWDKIFVGFGVRRCIYSVSEWFTLAPRSLFVLVLVLDRWAQTFVGFGVRSVINGDNRFVASLT